jgi:hypothetical protein
MSGARTQSFRYPLQALLRKHEWDVDALALEHAGASKALQEQEAEHARLNALLRDANADLARMRQAGAQLDLSRQRLLLDYRAVQEEAALAKEAQVRAARQVCDQIVQQLFRARQALKAFENHSAGLRQAHEREARTFAAKEADEIWLMARRAEKVRA